MPELNEVQWSSYGNVENPRVHRGEWEGYQCHIAPRSDRTGLYDVTIASIRNSWTPPMVAEGMTGLDAVHWCLENLETLRGSETERKKLYLQARNEERRRIENGFVAMNRLLGLEGERTFETIMGKMMAGLGLDRCQACGRELGEDERRHVRVGRTTWMDPVSGDHSHHRTTREARCTGCGPWEDFPNEPLRPDEINIGETGT